jgi:hypothetical protein
MAVHFPAALKNHRTPAFVDALTNDITGDINHKNYLPEKPESCEPFECNATRGRWAAAGPAPDRLLTGKSVCRQL